MTIVEVLVLRGASLASVAITFELLDTANRLRIAAGRPPVFKVGVSGSGARWAQAFTGQPPAPTGSKRADVIIVPGLGWSSEAMVLEGLRRKDVAWAKRRLLAATIEGAEIASSCSAVFLVASTGLLDGRRATTTWWLAPLFTRLFPDVTLEADSMIVIDERITSAGAAMAQLDLLLSIIARYADPSLAERCARYLLLDQRSSQARYMAVTFLAASDDRIARAERWARARLEESFSISELAAAAGLTSRTFARRLERAVGLSPVKFIQRLRVERALELLETTKLSFDEVARRVGYAEPSTLRRLLRREGSPGAREIRNAWSPPALPVPARTRSLKERRRAG